MKSGSMNGGSWIRKERRLAIVLRDKCTCMYCGRDLALANPREVTLDHLLPRSKGGSNHNTNLVVACLRCNSQRGNKDYTDYATGGAVDRIEVQRYLHVNIDLAKALIAGTAGDAAVEAER